MRLFEAALFHINFTTTTIASHRIACSSMEEASSSRYVLVDMQQSTTQLCQSLLAETTGVFEPDVDECLWIRLFRGAKHATINT
jgi:hypothetical protein